MARGKTNELVKTTVLLNGQQAQEEMKKLSARASEFAKKKREAFEQNDLTAYQKWDKALNSVNSEMRSMKKETVEVEQVLKNLNGVSMNDLRKAANKASYELKKMSQSDPGFTEKQKQVKALNDRYKELSGGMRTVQSSSGLFSLSMLKSLLPIASVTGAIAGATRIFKELFNLSKVMEGDSRRATIVFGKSLGFVEERAAELAEKMGMTNREFVAAAANTADLLIPLDFSREKAAQMSVELQSLSGALDEWTGGRIGAEQVSQILTKAMLGETEQLKQLGIAIRKDSDEFRNLVKSKMDAGAASKAQAEAETMLQLIYQKSTDAQTAYNAEGNKLLRLQKSISVWWRSMKENVVSYFASNPADKLRKEQEEVNGLVVELRSVNIEQERREQIMNRLQQIAPELLKSISDETSSVEDLTAAVAEYNKEMALKILIAEGDKDISKQKKKVDTFRKLTAEAEAELARQLKESIEWFERKAPGVKQTAETILFDTQKTLLQKAEELNSLALENTTLGNTSLFRTLDSYRTFRNNYNNELRELDYLITETNSSRDEWKRIFGGDMETPDGDKPQTEPEMERIKKFIAANQVAFDQMKLNSEQRLHILELTNRELENVQNVVSKMPEEDRSTPQVDLTFMEQLFEEGKANIIKKRSQNLITQQQYNEELENLEVAHLMTMMELRNRLGVDTMDIENRLQQIKMDNLNSIGEKEIQGFEAEKALLAEKYANNLISKEIFDQEMLNLEALHLQRLQEMYTFFGISTTDIDRQITEAKIQNLEKVKARTNEANTQMLQYYMNFVSAGTTALQEFVEGNEDALKNGAKAMIFILLDMVKAQMQLAIAGATIQSLMQPDSVATFGATGLVRAGIIITLIEGAFALAKGGISNILSGFEAGGYTPAATSNSKPVGIVHANEFVANAAAVNNPTVKPVLDMINYAQQNGMISRLNLPQIISATEFKSGGFTSLSDQAKALPSHWLINPFDKAQNQVLIKLAENTERLEAAILKIADGVDAKLVYQDYKRMSDKEQQAINRTM